MLGTAAAILLFLLPSQVNALITTDAKCLAGYDWMFSSIGQSPCDVAAELASVCIARPFNLEPLPVGYIYSPPTVANQNSCRCSSVYYSLLSGCAYCQDRSHRRWSTYVTNCSMIYLTVYNQEIPAGVKVPAYAYLDVSISDAFNATLAYNVKGVESSRPVPSGTQIPKPTLTSSLPAASGSNDGNGPTANNTTTVVNTPTSTPAIVGGVVGGLVGLGLIAAIITFLVLRSKQQSRSQNHNSNFQQSPNMAYTPNTTASLIHSAGSSPPAHGMLYNPNDPSTFPVPDSSMHYPYRQYSPQNVTPNFAGSSAQNYAPPRAMPQNTSGRPHYPGIPV